MAVPTYVTDLTTLDDADTNTWVEPTGMTAGTVVSPETDFFIQGAKCAAKYMTSGGTGLGALVRDNGSGVTIPTPGGFFIWIYPQGVNQLHDFANGGIRLIVGSSTANYYAWRVAGDDTIPYGGWICWVVDPSSPTTVTDDGTGLDADYQVGTPDDPLTKQVFGAGVNQQVNAKGGTGFDVMRYGRGEMKIEFGSVADGLALFSGAAAYNDNVSNRFGLFQAIAGGYLYKGLLLFGSATNAVDFRDSNTSILVENTARVTADFNTIEIRNASSRVDWTSVSWLALGTVAKGRLIVTDAADVNISNCSFTGMDTFVLQASVDVLNSTFRSSNAITAAGANLSGTQVLVPTVAADTSAVIWNVATDTDGKLNSTEFSKGTNAHHAIEFGTTSPVDLTLREVTFTGFNAANSNNDSTFHVKRTTGDVTINCIDCTGNLSYKSAGANVSIVTGTVTVKVTARDASTAALLDDVRVLLRASSGATVTITRSGSTATVTHTAHGYTTGKKVTILGAVQGEYNGVYTITVVDVDTYTYAVSGTPATPATGTITSYRVILDGLTVSGVIQDTGFVYVSDLAVTGAARRFTVAPSYKPSPLSGTIIATGFDQTAFMILD